MKLPQAGSQQTRLNKGFRHWPSFRRWFVWNANHGYCHAVLSPFPARSRHVFAVHGHPIHVKNKFRGEKLRVIVTSEREREREREMMVRWRGHLFTGHPRRYPKFRVLVSVRRGGCLVGRWKIEGLQEISISSVCQNVGDSWNVGETRFCQVFRRGEV